MDSWGAYHSCMEVNLDIIKENVAKIREYIGPDHQMIGVVKGDAYGLGAIPVARMLTEESGFDLLAVAHACEGIALRKAGIGQKILLMSAVPQAAIPEIVHYDLQMTAFSPEMVQILEQEAARQGKCVSVHIKVETGMNRIGARPGEELAVLLNTLKSCSHISVEGCYTHFATSKEYQDAFALEQLARFKVGVRQIKASGIHPIYIHAANTGATIWLRESYGTHVRCAGLMYGYSKMNDRSNPVGVIEAASWRTVITNIRSLKPGESAGYNRFFMPAEPAKVAVLGVGYVDGLHRDVALSGGPVLVNGKRTRFVGACMDQSFIDITGIDCKIGDIVTLIGRDGDETVSPFHLMDCAPFATCASFFTSISNRVYRRWIHEKH